MVVLKIGNHFIGDNSKPFVIAEVRINHNGDKNLAKKMILSAKESGADAVKIQSFKVESFCLKKSTYYSLFQRCQLNESEWRSSMIIHVKLAFFFHLFLMNGLLISAIN